MHTQRPPGWIQSLLSATMVQSFLEDPCFILDTRILDIRKPESNESGHNPLDKGEKHSVLQWLLLPPALGNVPPCGAGGWIWRSGVTTSPRPPSALTCWQRFSHSDWLPYTKCHRSLWVRVRKTFMAPCFNMCLCPILDKAQFLYEIWVVEVEIRACFFSPALYYSIAFYVPVTLLVLLWIPETWFHLLSGWHCSLLCSCCWSQKNSFNKSWQDQAPVVSLKFQVQFLWKMLTMQ